MTRFLITLLPGDGIGPEITAVARQMLDAVSRIHGFELIYNEQPMGAAPSTPPANPFPPAPSMPARPPTRFC